MINNTSSGNSGKSSGTGTSLSGPGMSTNIGRPNSATGQESPIFEQRPTADNPSRDRSHVLYSGSRAFPSSPFDPSKKRGNGGVSPLLIDPSQRGLAPPLRSPYKRLSHRRCTSMLTMLLSGPISVFSLAFFWVAILLHTQVTHLHLDGPQGVQQRLPARQVRRIVGPPRKHARGIRLVVRMQTRPVEKESVAPVDRPPRDGKAATTVRIRVYHVRPKPGDLPRKPERPTKHRRVLVRTIPVRSSQHSTKYETTSAQASDTSTQPHHHEFGSTFPPVPSSEDQSQLGTPHTTKVGHTFPLVKR